MSTLMEELTAIKAVEDKLTANKVANFAYTDHAYNNPLTEADGVETYNVDNEQNIPVANASILKVNTTILTKGWRAQASAITRMLMNHFLGRCSYNLNKVNDLFSLLLTKFMAFLGTPNGIATLDANGRIPYSQLPESAVELKGYWDADTNTPTLVDGIGTNGDEYIVSVAGTQDLGSGSQYFNVGDRVLYAGGVWKNIISGSVRTVNNNPPDARGNIRAVLGTDTFPITIKFLRAVFSWLVGKSWTQGTGGNTGDAIWNLTYANGLWVCASDYVNEYGLMRGHGAWWSEDGKSWTQGTGENTIYSMRYVVYANGLWVCGSKLHGMWWSEDGKSWTQGTGENTTYTMQYVVYANGLWVCGSDSHGLWWSEDGKSWTQGTGANTTYSMNSSVYANGLWVCGSGSHGLWWSEDGKSWTQGTGANTTYTMQYLVYANGLWVCGSGGGHGMWWSEDGKSWTQGTGANTTYDMRNLVYANGLWVCGTDFQHGIWWSEDGKSWTQGTSEDTDYPDHYSTAYLVYVNGLWVCAGNGAWWSEDGKSWTKGTGVGGNTYYVVYANGLWVCGGANGLWWSEDGKGWTKGTGLSSSCQFSGESIAYANGLWVGGSYSNGIWYSKSVDDLIAEGAIDLGADIPIVSE